MAFLLCEWSFVPAIIHLFARSGNDGFQNFPVFLLFSGCQASVQECLADISFNGNAEWPT